MYKKLSKNKTSSIKQLFNNSKMDKYYSIEIIAPSGKVTKDMVIRGLPQKDHESMNWICTSSKGEEIRISTRLSIRVAFEIEPDDDINLYE
jgi:hypothetical protein